MTKRKLKKLFKQETKKLGIANNNIFEQMNEIHALNNINAINENALKMAERELYRKEIIIQYLEIKLLEKGSQ